MTFRDYTGTGNECWLVNGGAGSTLGSLGYKYLNDQLVYPLFTRERFKGAEYFKSKDIKNIVKAEMNFQGKHYVCTEEKILEKLEKGFSKGKKLDGRSGCPFDDMLLLQNSMKPSNHEKAAGRKQLLPTAHKCIREYTASYPWACFRPADARAHSRR